MMYNYPFFSFPNFRRYPYYPSYYQKPLDIPSSSIKPNIISRQDPRTSNKYNSGIDTRTSKNSQNSQNKKEENNTKKVYSGFNFLDNFLHQDDRSEEKEVFEILGIKLYNDDILLLGLLFFLYKEDVKDQYLFIALILLLLS